MQHANLPNGAWVMIGDGRKALWLRNEGDAELLDLRRFAVETQVNPSTHEQGTSAPGRSHSSVGHGRSAIQETDWHQIGEDRFVTAVAKAIDAAAERNDFKHILIVLPPKALGELRKHLSKAALARIAGEINKDLTHHTIPEIEALLKHP